jgi:hypothetical protein
MGEDDIVDEASDVPQTFFQRYRTIIIVAIAVVVVGAIIAIAYFSRQGSGGGGGGLSSLLGGSKSEVYYYDNAGNDDRYKMSFDAAKTLAGSLKGAVATPAQLADAQKAGLDACWIGYGSDGKQYIPNNTDWGPVSGCNAPTLASSAKYQTAGGGAGVWVYGPKPAKTSTNDCSTNPSTPCSVGWTKTQWSQYA